jgi:single-strand DNA-binding protein
MNRVEISGRLTKDVEVRKSQTNMSCGNFTLALNDYVGVDNNKKPKYETSFINCSIFGSKCDTFTKYHHKGDFAVVMGKIHQRKYTNKQGQEISTIEIIVEDYDLLPKTKTNTTQPQVQFDRQPQIEVPVDDLGNDDLPF